MPVMDRTAQHSEHDPFAIAQLAADDLHPSERPEVEVLVAECRDCATLLSDLRALTSATAALPPMPAALRPRDFRLTEEDAARLGRGGWRRWFGVARSPRLAFTQPLGVGLATIGLAGLLISGGSFSAFSTAPAAAPVSDQGSSGGGAAVREAPSSDAASDNDLTTKTAAEPTATTGPAAALPAPNSPSTGDTQAQAPQVGAPPATGDQAASPEAESMVGSPEPEDSSTVAPPAGAAPAPEAGDDARDAAEVDAAATPEPASTTGWLALLVAGIALVLFRPIATRFARR